jgi:transposase
MIWGMNDYTLPPNELKELRFEHRRTREKRYADRLKAVILLGSGWPAEQVAEALLIDPDTARSYFKRYREGGTRALLSMAYSGGGGWLSEEQLIELNLHLRKTLYLTAKEVAHYVEEQWGVRYSERGMSALLRRQGYVYKKPKLVPGKADAEAQRGFLEKYKKLKENKSPEDPIYFMDATHPHHNPALGYGWIKRGEEREIPSNTGRKRLNINGAIELERLEPVVRFDATIDSTSTIALFEQIEQANSQAQRIYVICDNAGYYRSQAVQHFLESSKIELIFLPSYSPNLNLIERFWKFFKKQVLYNKYYDTFSKFRKACEQFFQSSHTYADQLRSLLTENFQIIGEKKPKFGIP